MAMLAWFWGPVITALTTKSWMSLAVPFLLYRRATTAVLSPSWDCESHAITKAPPEPMATSGRRWAEVVNVFT